MIGRREAIEQVLERHGTDAIYVASTGYVGRAVFEVADDRHDVFYMQGSMGMAPAIGLGIALNGPTPVVVINGDASLLMSLGTTHTIRTRAPNHFFHYVLDNECHESVGGQACAPLERAYPGVTEVIEIDREGPRPRVEIAPPANTQLIRGRLAGGPVPAPEEL